MVAWQVDKASSFLIIIRVDRNFIDIENLTKGNHYISFVLASMRGTTFFSESRSLFNSLMIRIHCFFSHSHWL